MSVSDHFNPLDVGYAVVNEQGRWAVYLLISYWDDDSPEQLQTVRHRINSYPRREQAERAASLICRAVDRNPALPPTGR